MEQIKNVSDKCNNIFTVCDDMDIVYTVYDVTIYYKHDLMLLLLLVM